MRKILVTLLVLAMVLGTVSAAFAFPAAVSFPDISGNTYAKPIIKLASLGVLGGYPDGTFGPDKNISRAEFAAMIVRALGLESAAKILSTPTKFADVTSANAWAYGYINLAASKGIVTGYPDGTFRPTANVTNAEALTMIVRALGRESEAVGAWPTGDIMVASAQGIIPETADIVVGAPATRAMVVAFVNNALAADIMKTDKDGMLVKSGDTMLSLLKATSQTGVVKTAVAATSTAKAYLTFADDTILPKDSDALDDKVSLLGTATLYGATKVEQFQAQSVYALCDADGYAFFVMPTTTTSVTGVVTAVNAGSSKITVDTTVYKVASDATVQLNGASAGSILAEALLKIKDADVTAVLNASGYLTLIKAYDYDTTGTLTSKRSAVTVDGTIDYITVAGDEYALTDDTTIVRNGVAAKFADLVANDKVKLATNGHEVAMIDAFNQVVEGIVVSTVAQKNTPSVTLNVNGTNTVVPVAVDKYGNSVITIGNVLVNTKVKMWLDSTGKAYTFSMADTASPEGKVTAVATSVTSTGTVSTVTLDTGSVYTLVATPTINLNLVSASATDLNGAYAILTIGSGANAGKVTQIDAFMAVTGEVATNAGAYNVTDSDDVVTATPVQGSTVYTLNGKASYKGEVDTELGVAGIVANATVTWDTENSKAATVAVTTFDSETTYDQPVIGTGSTVSGSTTVSQFTTPAATYSLDSKAIIVKDGATASVADIAVGDKVSFRISSSKVVYVEIATDEDAPEMTAASEFSTANYVFTLDEAVDASTVVAYLNGTKVAADKLTTSYTASTRETTVTIIPTAAFVNGTSYTVSFEAADYTGNYVSDTWTSQYDTTPATAAAVVKTTTTVTATFDDNMNAAEVADKANWAITDHVVSAASYNADTRTLTLTLGTASDGDEPLAVAGGKTVHDAAGNALTTINTTH